MIFLLVLKTYRGANGRVYRKWQVDVLETASYVNIILFCLLKLYVLESTDDKGHAILAYTSGSISIVLLLIVIISHTYFEVIARVGLWTKLVQIMKKGQDVILNENEVSLVDNDQLQTTKVTHSFMDGCPGDELPLMVLIQTKLTWEVKNSIRSTTQKEDETCIVTVPTLSRNTHSDSLIEL